MYLLFTPQSNPRDLASLTCVNHLYWVSHSSPVAACKHNEKSEHLDEYINRNMHVIITVCDGANQSCPIFTDGEVKIHWSIKDPFHGWGNDAKQLQPYRDTRNDLNNRIDDFLSWGKLNDL